ncbi:MAG: hypothetical protein ABIJ81_00840 [Patescibacteria group bacterium]
MIHILFKKKFNNKHPARPAGCAGFSLTEVTIAVFITLILIVVVYSVFILVRQTQRRVDDRAEVVQNQRTVLDRLSRELRQANMIVTTLPAAEIQFEDGHGNIAEEPIQYLRYHLEGSDLYREVSYYSFATDPSAHVYYDDIDDFDNPPNQTIVEDRLVGEYLTSLDFSGFSIITISVSFSQNNETITLSTNVAPRNLN